MKLYEIDMFKGLFCTAQGDQALDSLDLIRLDSLNLWYMTTLVRAFD